TERSLSPEAVPERIDHLEDKLRGSPTRQPRRQSVDVVHIALVIHVVAEPDVDSVAIDAALAVVAIPEVVPVARLLELGAVVAAHGAEGTDVLHAPRAAARVDGWADHGAEATDVVHERREAAPVVAPVERVRIDRLVVTVERSVDPLGSYCACG